MKEADPEVKDFEDFYWHHPNLRHFQIYLNDGYLQMPKKSSTLEHISPSLHDDCIHSPDSEFIIYVLKEHLTTKYILGYNNSNCFCVLILSYAFYFYSF